MRSSHVVMLSLGLALGADRAADRAPQAVTVVGMDYAFKVPAHIRAGETAFAFENRGTVRHEMVISALRSGMTLDSLVRGMAVGRPRREFAEGQAALVIGMPTDPPGPRVVFDLVRGRTYVVVCQLTDSAGKPPHVQMGMVSSFVPE